jgi:hypothetical protein
MQYPHRYHSGRTTKKQEETKEKESRSKKGAQKEQTKPPNDVGRGNDTGDTEMNEVETSHQQKQGG